MNRSFYEFFFREVAFFLRSIFKIGKLRHCPICNWKFTHFLPTGIEKRTDVRCPRCNSHERHRAIWLYLNQNTDFFNCAHKSLLHIAPEFCFARKFRKIRNLSYKSIDLKYGLALHREDISKLSYIDSTFNHFIIVHVLEHIQNETAALSELYRILKPGGWGIIQVPMDLSLNRTKEDPSIDTPEKRLRVFGQKDHVRLYAIDFKNKLEGMGFQVIYVDMSAAFSENERQRFRIISEEPFYFVRRPLEGTALSIKICLEK